MRFRPSWLRPSVERSSDTFRGPVTESSDSMCATVVKVVAKDIATSSRLGAVRQRGTDPEMRVRRALHRLGHRYRTGDKRLPGRPDIVNRTGKWAIFVHGCFWHHHAGCRRATIPKNNISFWLAKFAANKERDD